MAVAGRRLLEAKKSGTLPEDARVDPADPYAIADFYTAAFLEECRNPWHEGCSGGKGRSNAPAQTHQVGAADGCARREAHRQ